ncbi:MAG: DsrE family protein [Myxococcota bacterium]
MAKILITLVSGPEAELRAKEGLSLARAIHEVGMAQAVSLFLTGPGVLALSSEDPRCVDLREALEAVLAAGVPVAACTRSLAEHDLLGEVEALGVAPAGAPVFLSEKIDEGYAMLSF